MVYATWARISQLEENQPIFFLGFIFQLTPSPFAGPQCNRTDGRVLGQGGQRGLARVLGDMWAGLSLDAKILLVPLLLTCLLVQRLPLLQPSLL